MNDDNVLGFPHGHKGVNNGPVDPVVEFTADFEVGEANPNGTDLIKSPPHYNRNGVETWDVIEHIIAEYPDPVASYHVSSMFKYCDRAPYKGHFWQDLRKAIQHAKRLEKYLDRLGK